MLRNLFVIVLVALTASACSSSRQATHEQREFRVECSEFRDSSKVESLVVLDTIMETKTITITKNEAGDTISHSVVTDRLRLRDKSDVRSKMVDVRAVHDTVYIATRDSVSSSTFQSSRGSSRTSSVVSGLKWVFWIIVGLIAYKLTAYVIGRRVL